MKPMKPRNSLTGRRGPAFTLIELLVVIAIISILAALIIPASVAIKNRSKLRQARTELQSVATVIESYKSKLGHYPPDSPNGPLVNQLYFELVGTTYDPANGTYATLDGVCVTNSATLKSIFGVEGIINCTRGSSDDARPAVNFFRAGLRPGQYLDLVTNVPPVRILTCGVAWPDTSKSPWQLIPAFPNANPWRYSSSNPTNNPGGFDLWVDIVVGNDTYRIGNWNNQPIKVYAP
jgi:prepilin-type N-terminal cleavage/methylation domain-containing protein